MSTSLTSQRIQYQPNEILNYDKAITSAMTTCETMDLQSAANYLGAKAETISQLARKGELPGAQVGKGWIFLREDVLDFLRKRIASETEARRAESDNARSKNNNVNRSMHQVAELQVRTRRRPPPLLPQLPSTMLHHS